MKLCVDCEHYSEDDDVHYCNRVTKIHPVTGKVKNKSCPSERFTWDLFARISGECGRSGRFFKPKEEIDGK